MLRAAAIFYHGLGKLRSAYTYSSTGLAAAAAAAGGIFGI